MSDNVIILGAGASFDAGIPLMGNFMDSMWTMARTKRGRDGPLDDRDVSILNDALAVRDELDHFHGRAALDVWNIEDILSVLSFREGESLSKMTKAIARVIELSCLVKHDGNVRRAIDSPTLYIRFWRALLKWALGNQKPIPPIITFNYDLVLERSLLHALVGPWIRPADLVPKKGLHIRYEAESLKGFDVGFDIADFFSGAGTPSSQGIVLTELQNPSSSHSESALSVELLKLHGSLNFAAQSASVADAHGFSKLIDAQPEPLIIPPVFNKATDSIGKGVWTRALSVLGNCKNLIICGYSLPATDIYMQYFLKAALGPNTDLNHIYVFDPTLFDPEGGESLRRRYSSNFSAPIQRRIEFRPEGAVQFGASSGTMEHLTAVLDKKPGLVLFA